MDISQDKSMDELEVKGFGFDRLFTNTGDDPVGRNLGGMVSPRLLKSIYESEDWVFIMVDRIASKLSQIPWQVYQQTIKGGEEILKAAFGHPLQKILDQPNPLQSEYAFKYSLITDLSVTGNSLIFVSSSQKWLVHVPTDIIQPDIDGRGNLNAYNIVGLDPSNFPTSAVYKLPARDVIHVKRPNSSSVHWGLSPLIPGSYPALFNKYSNEYLINFYRKGAQPGIVLEMTEETNEQQAKKLLASLETAYTGRTNQRRGMVLPKGVKATNMSHTLADQQLIEYIRNNRETLINIYGVPKHELSIAESGSLGSEEYKVALKNFWQGPLMSIGKMFESALTARLAGWLGQGYVIRLNYSNVPILQEDLKEKADVAQSMLGTMTYNEVRQKVWKLPPVEGGDVLRDLRQPALPQFPGFAASAAPTVPTKSMDGETDYRNHNILALASFSKAEGNEWLLEAQQRVEEESKKAAEKLEKLWLKLLEDQVIAAVKVAKEFMVEKAAEVTSKRKLRRAIDEAMDEVEDQWASGYTDALEGQVELGYDSAISIPFNEPYKDGIEAIRETNSRGRRETLEARGLDSFSKISQTTTERIMAAIEAGLSRSDSIQKIAEKIRSIGIESASRALTIARTETLVANSIGQAAAVKDAAKVIPKLVKVWINAGDNRVRGNPAGLYPDSQADHWAIMGEIVDHDESFSNGLDYPRDTKGNAANVINCRCTMLVVSEDDLPKFGFKR